MQTRLSARTSNLSAVKHRSEQKQLTNWRKLSANDLFTKLCGDSNVLWYTMIGLFWFEVALNLFIINYVKYTEIDWSTYMEQVAHFADGTRDYGLIGGQTGPLVYPAAHLYIYSILYYLTNGGTNIRLAQYMFALIYLITLFCVFRIYWKCSVKLPPYALLFMCCTSYRIHSIYSLRLFNDTIAMAFLYIAVNLFIDRKWTIGCVIYSVAVSVKMNVLLFSPGLLLLLLETNTRRDFIKNLSLCAFVQVLLGLPFLISHPMSYISRSFNIGRVFMHKWTVNWRFIPEYIFVSHYFHITLLICHLVCLFFIFKKRWLNFVKWLPVTKTTSGLLSNEPNFIGISFSRSLHYQFYVWYFHSLPFIMWQTWYKPKTKLCILGFIELAWNTYPSTNWSSGLLHFLHFLIILSLFKHSK